MFTVRDTDAHVTVTASLSSQWTPLDLATNTPTSAGVLGFPYAHAWSQFALSVSDGSRQVARYGPVEPYNISTELGEVGYSRDRSEALSFTLTCGFDRRPGDPVGYVAAVQGSVDGR